MVHHEPSGPRTVENWRVERTGEAVSGEKAACVVRASIEAGRLDVRFVRQPDGTLSVTTNGRRAMLIVWGRAGYDEGVMAVDPKAGDGTQGGYALANGQHDTYADAETVPLDQAIDAIQHIIDRGVLDPSLQWKSWA
jgi:hypothetical protein